LRANRVLTLLPVIVLPLLDTHVISYLAE